MVKISKIILLFASLACISGSLFAQGGFNSVYSKDGTIVIAVGNSGNCFISYDGGANFGSYPVGAVNLNSVAHFGSNIVIAGNSGLIFNSTNNGNTWNNSANGAQNLNGITMADANTGWVVGNNGAIYKTTNGGVNWSSQTSPNANNLRSVKATSTTAAVACGDNGTVIYTTNGSTWTAYTTGATMNLLAVDQKGTTIIATGADGKAYKYNGSTWSPIDYKILVKSEIRGISMIDANNFYSCGGGGFVRKSTDGGTTFTIQKNPMIAPLSSIYFINGIMGWAVANTNNAIMRTTDGGASWNFQSAVTVTFNNWVLKQSSSSNIGNGFCLHPTNKNGIFCMMGNIVYRSLDKGETWVNIATCATGGACHTFFVSPLDTNIMMCSKGSSGGYVCRSTNYGATWTSVWGPGTLTSYGMPLQMDDNNPSVYYLAPDNHVFMKSTDNGLTFSDIGTYTFRSPCDIAVQFYNSSVIWVGDGTTSVGLGDFWKSTNGGVNWTMIQTAGSSEIPMIATTNLNVNVLYRTTWSSGGFWKSTDAGSTLFNTNGPSSNLWGADIAKDDPNSVVYGTYGSAGYLSTDDGSTFNNQNLVSSPGAGTLYYDKTLAFMQQGGGIYKMNITYTVTPPTGSHQISSEVPKQFGLVQNYPNPFNPSTQIQYNVSRQSFVTIRVYDMTGTEVASLVNSNQTAGKYSIDFNASNIASGVYFYTMFANGSKIDTKKMMLVK